MDGKEFVTARSWVDLSDMMKLYEEHDIPVNLELIRQYVQNERIARDFSAYYDLFYRYRKDYRIDDILKGAVEDGVRTRAQESSFDERITVIRLLMDSLSGDFRKVNEWGEALNRFLLSIKENNRRLAAASVPEAVEILRETEEAIGANLRRERKSKSVSAKELRLEKLHLKYLEDLSLTLQRDSMDGTTSDPVSLIREFIAPNQAERKKLAGEAGNRLEAAFDFIRDAYGENEMIIFVTSLTENRESAGYIGTYGSESSYRYNKELLLNDREDELVRKIRELEV